jgi:hypothetical protein
MFFVMEMTPHLVEVGVGVSPYSKKKMPIVILN